MDLRIVDFECESLIIAPERLCKSAELEQCNAAIDVGAGMVRLERDGAIVARQRRLKAPAPELHVPAVEAGFGVVGTDRQCVVEQPLSFSKVSALRLDDAKHVHRIETSAVERENEAILAFC